MSHQQFEVGIIGGGPAGASLGLSLSQRGISVAIVERSNYKGWHPGEALTAQASALLSKLNLNAGEIMSKVRHVSSQAIQTSWGSTELIERHSIHNPYGTGWYIDRNQFDEALVNEARQAGAEVFRQSNCISVLQKSDHWDLGVTNGFDNYFHLRAKFLVDATGRMARVARSLGAGLHFYDQLISIIAIVTPEGTCEKSNEAVLTLEAVGDGWWYLVPLPTGELLAAFMTDSDIFLKSGQSPRAYWSKMVKNTKHMSRLIGKAKPTKIEMRNSRVSLLNPILGRQWVALGDAAFAPDPLSGDGIQRAIESGLESSHLIFQSFNNEYCERYHDRLQSSFKRYLAQLRDYYSMEQRWPNALFWYRRRQAMTKTVSHA